MPDTEPEKGQAEPTFWDQISSVLRDENFTTILKHVSAVRHGRHVSLPSDLVCNNRLLLQLFGIRQELGGSWKEILQVFAKLFPELPQTKFRWKVETCVRQAQRHVANGEPLHDFFNVTDTVKFCSVGPICDGIGIYEADIIGDTNDVKLKTSGSDEPVVLTNSLVNEIVKFAKKKKLTVSRQNVIFQALGANSMSDKDFKEVIGDIRSTYSRTIKSKSRKVVHGKSEFETFCNRLSGLVGKGGATNTYFSHGHGHGTGTCTSTSSTTSGTGTCTSSSTTSTTSGTGRQQACSVNQPGPLELEGVMPTASASISDQMKLMHRARDMRILKGELAEREQEVGELNAKLSACREQAIATSTDLQKMHAEHFLLQTKFTELKLSYTILTKSHKLTVDENTELQSRAKYKRLCLGKRRF